MRLLALFLVSSLACVQGQKRFAAATFSFSSQRQEYPMFEPRTIQSPNSVQMDYVTIWRMIEEAFPAYSWLQIHTPRQLGPLGGGSGHFSITAIYPQGAGPNDLSEMMQSLLADKFGMSWKVEKQTTPIFSLAVDTKGHNNLNKRVGLPPSAAQRQALTTRPAPMVPDANNIRLPLPKSGVPAVRPGRLYSHHEFSGTMAELASFLSKRMHYVVCDDTKLKGIYHFSLDVEKPGTANVDEEGLIVDAQRDFVWLQYVEAFKRTVLANGLELTPATQSMDNIVIYKMNPAPR